MYPAAGRTARSGVAVGLYLTTGGGGGVPTVVLRARWREPVIRYRRPADRRSRPQQWNDGVQTILELQEQYRAWRDALPESLAGSATAELLEQVCDLDLSVLQAVALAQGLRA